MPGLQLEKNIEVEDIWEMVLRFIDTFQLAMLSSE